ncbi:MAG: hypothetical protein P1U88_10600 [Thalassobaculaceae bacterium]|nr:hypothetical protein [Thalassobaculaceae bacterium]
MSQWNDFLLRSSLSDTGAIPRTFGWESPDIIPAGIIPVANPGSVYTTASSYATDPGTNLTYNATNYIYVRAKNLADGANAGVVNLYYSNSDLLNYPSNWSQIGGDGGLAISAAGNGDIVTPSQGFVWPSVPPQPANFHYCLISWVKTAAHPNPPTGDSIGNLATFISQNGNWSQRNIAIVDSNSPTFVKSVNYNQGSEAATMNFSLTWTDAPVGAQVQLVARTPVNGHTINSELQTIQAPNTGFVIPQIDIPANYSSVMDINYYANGKTSTSSWNFTLNAYYFVPPSNKELTKFGQSMEAFGIGHLPIAQTNVPMRAAGEEIGPTPAVLVGSQVIKVGL